MTLKRIKPLFFPELLYYGGCCSTAHYLALYLAPSVIEPVSTAIWWDDGELAGEWSIGVYEKFVGHPAIANDLISPITGDSFLLDTKTGVLLCGHDLKNTFVIVNQPRSPITTDAQLLAKLMRNSQLGRGEEKIGFPSPSIEQEFEQYKFWQSIYVPYLQHFLTGGLVDELVAKARGEGRQAEIAQKLLIRTKQLLGLEAT